VLESGEAAVQVKLISGCGKSCGRLRGGHHHSQAMLWKQTTLQCTHCNFTFLKYKSQTSLRITHGHSFHVALVFTVSYRTDSGIHALKRPTDLDKCIDILESGTKLCFCLWFFG